MASLGTRTSDVRLYLYQFVHILAPAITRMTFAAVLPRLATAEWLNVTIAMSGVTAAFGMRYFGEVSPKKKGHVAWKRGSLFGTRTVG